MCKKHCTSHHILHETRECINNTDLREWEVVHKYIHRKESITWYRLYPEFCKDHLEDASLHAKSLRLAMEAS